VRKMRELANPRTHRSLPRLSWFAKTKELLRYNGRVKPLAVTLVLSAMFLGAPVCAQVSDLEKQVAAQRKLLSDWGGVLRYGSDNTEIPAPAPGENRVVFIGDEITEAWGRGAAKFFPGKPYWNRGIAGQTSPQLLVRFRQDVISLEPKVVVILIGTNDLYGRFSPGTQATIAENIMSMTELARVHGIRVVLASLTPVCDCFTNVTSRIPAGKVLGVNRWLKEYAAQSGSVYLDYYSVLAEGRAFRKELTTDGRLPNDAGYNVMAPVAEAAIAGALKTPGAPF
jgi:lysophospholipase L1-like esterase